MSALYSLYGLVVRSALSLPELPPGAGAADVEIAYAPVAGTLPSPVSSTQIEDMLLQAAPGRALIAARGCRILVQDGRRIELDVDPGTAEAELRRFALGSGTAALLHQRGVLPLHGSAVVVPAGALVIVGYSGRGKSTTAAALAARGHTLLCDDLCPVVVHRGALCVQPGPSRLRLPADSLAALGFAAALGAKRVEPGTDDKAELELEALLDAGPRPIAAVVWLRARPVDAVSVEPVAGRERFRALSEHTSRRCLLAGLGGREAHFQAIVTLAAGVPMYRVDRPTGRLALPELVAALADAGLLGPRIQ